MRQPAGLDAIPFARNKCPLYDWYNIHAVMGCTVDLEPRASALTAVDRVDGLTGEDGARALWPEERDGRRPLHSLAAWAASEEDPPDALGDVTADAPVDADAGSSAHGEPELQRSIRRSCCTRRGQLGSSLRTRSERAILRNAPRADSNVVVTVVSLGLPMGRAVAARSGALPVALPASRADGASEVVALLKQSRYTARTV